jgi:hypothetical protein
MLDIGCWRELWVREELTGVYEKLTKVREEFTGVREM